MKRNLTKTISAVMAALMVAGSVPAHVFAAVENGWETVDGKKYWYENSVKQGLEGRGKEIYDPDSNAWYWLDSVSDGAMAAGKDLYQESMAGQWAENFVEGDWEASTGKWVRYDENGHMVKGWYENENGRYYFDEVFGTMAKGYAVIKNDNGKYIEYYFDTASGILLRELGETPENGWKNVEGIDVWYENHIRQGYSIDASYRGKEIYDAGSDAWYWLDSIDNGKRAISKDVYQESKADDAGNMGKWVRYDENGHMIKGWDENDNGVYYFDPVYGTMAKGEVYIDGYKCIFDSLTGVLINKENMLVWKISSSSTYNADGRLLSQNVFEYDDYGNCITESRYKRSSGQLIYCEKKEYQNKHELIRDRVSEYNEDYEYLEKETITEYEDGYFKAQLINEYNAYGEIIRTLATCYENNNIISITEEFPSNPKSNIYHEYEYDEQGNLKRIIKTDADGEEIFVTNYYYENGSLSYYEVCDTEYDFVSERREYKYDSNKNCIENKYYYQSMLNLDGEEKQLRLKNRITYRYDNNNRLVEQNFFQYDDAGNEKHSGKTEYTYENLSDIRSYDSYYAHPAKDENGNYVFDESGNPQYFLGYNYGYINEISESGILIRKTIYEGDILSNYDRKFKYVVEYSTNKLEAAQNLYERQIIKPFSVTYNADGVVRESVVNEYIACYNFTGVEKD